ncbi:MAG: (2Fe-2S)-binding protein [Christensenellaceae bacterium]
MENQIICNCKQVSVADIEKALHTHARFDDVDKEFEEVQRLTKCSTGCGGCHDKIFRRHFSVDERIKNDRA